MRDLEYVDNLVLVGKACMRTFHNGWSVDMGLSYSHANKPNNTHTHKLFQWSMCTRKVRSLALCSVPLYSVHPI